MAYSKKDTEYLIQTYTSNPCMETVDKLCVDLNRTRKSIIAKLSKEAVYEKQGYRDKTGAIPEIKTNVVRDIENVFGASLPGLDKAPKQTLKTLRDLIVDQDAYLEEALGEITDMAESNEIKSQMLRSRMRAIR